MSNGQVDWPSTGCSPIWPRALDVIQGRPVTEGGMMSVRANPTAGGDGPRGVQSVATALELLDCLATEPELGVAELGRRLGVAKSTAHRIVTTLCAKGYVQHVPETQPYRLGIRLHELGELVASRNQLRDHALPLLEPLRNQTGETVHLAVPEGAQMFYVERLESYHGLRFSSRVSRVRPIHLTSSGKAVAAFNPAVAEAASARDSRRTARTIRSKRAVPPLPGRDAQAGLRVHDRGGRAGPLFGGGPGARSRRRRPGCDLGRRSGHPDHRIHIGQMARRVQAAAQQLMSIEPRLVERVGLPLTWFAERNAVRHRGTFIFPFPVRSLDGMTFRRPGTCLTRLSWDSIVQAAGKLNPEGAMEQGRRGFRNPYDIETPPGAEGWETMYPAYLLFGEELRERDEQKLWFFDQMHNPEPVYPFDLMMPESWLVSLNQYTTRIWNLPTALGIEQRIVNGYLYLSPNVIDDPAMIAEREPIFLERARHYFENWDEIYDEWVAKATDCIERLKDMHFEPLAEREPERTVFEHRRHDHGLRPARELQPPPREHARDGLLPLRDAEPLVWRLPDVPRVLPKPFPRHHRRPGREDGRRHRRHLVPAGRGAAPSRRRAVELGVGDLDSPGEPQRVSAAPHQRRPPARSGLPTSSR